MRTESTGGRSAKQKYWQNHIKGWKESGLSQAAYCEAQSLAIQTFGYWRRKLKVSGEEARPRFFPLAVMASHSSATASRARIKLTLQEQRFSIEVDDDFSANTLQRLIAALEQL